MEINDLLKDKDALKQLIGALQNLVDQTSGDESSADEGSNDERENIMNTKTRKKIYSNDRKPGKKNKNFVNRFDDMMERNMHKEDVEIDKLLKKHPKTPRNRKSNMIDVVCRVCGGKETIPSSLLTDTKDRYKCNTCSTRAG